MILEYNTIATSTFNEVAFFDELIKEYQKQHPDDPELKYISSFVWNHMDVLFNIHPDNIILWEDLTEDCAEEIINEFYRYIDND